MFFLEIRPAYRIDIERCGKHLIMDRSSDEPDVHSNKRVFDYVKQTTKQIAESHGQYIEAQSYRLGTIRLLIRSWVPCVDYDEAPDDAFLNQQMVELDIGESSSRSNHKVQVSPEHKWHAVLTAQRRYKRVDLTTNSMNHDSDNAAGKWPDLFFSDMPKLIMCTHKWGSVKGIKEFTIEEIEQSFTNKYNASPSYFLAKVMRLLEEILETINQQPQDKTLFTLICEFDRLGDDPLERAPSELFLFKRVTTDSTERFLPP